MEQEKPQQEVHSEHDKTGAETHEKKCLNCGAVLDGKYCQQCGQKDAELQEPFHHIIGEFISDFFHFDSKFFKTFIPLLFRPGVLTLEYCNGKRARYVHPIRLYFFVSVLFFLFYFSLVPNEFLSQVAIVDSEPDSVAGQALNETGDSITRLIGNENASIFIKEPEIRGIDSATEERIEIGRSLPKTVAAYEDSIRKLPEDSMPGFFTQMIETRAIEMNEKGVKESLKEIVEVANHALPKAMFLLLPAFALLLKLLYIRHRIYFVDHAIFTLHFHAFAFFLFLLALLISLFFKLAFGWFILLLLVYLFIGLRKVYKQSYGKTFVKTMLLLALYGTSFGISFLLLFIYAAIVA